MKKLTLLFCIITGFPLSLLQGALMLEHSAKVMCFVADLILEGEWLGENTIYFETVYKGEDLLEANQTTVLVEKLGLHNRTFSNYYSKKIAGSDMTATRLLAFLKRSDTGKYWRSLNTIETPGDCGSHGIIWYDDAGTYGYEQALNPGPLTLFRGEDIRTIPNSIIQLRSDLQSSLEVAQEIDRSLTIEDPKRKAAVLSRYLLESTYPEGFTTSIPINIRVELSKLGGDAVPAVIDTLERANANDRLDLAVLVLYDIGPAAKPAVAKLLDLLDREDQVHPQYVIGTLGQIGDPEAIPFIEPFLNHENQEIAEKAQLALDWIKAKSQN